VLRKACFFILVPSIFLPQVQPRYHHPFTFLIFPCFHRFILLVIDILSHAHLLTAIIKSSDYIFRSDMSSDSPVATRMDCRLSAADPNSEYSNYLRKQKQQQRNSFTALGTTSPHTPDSRTTQHRHSMAVYMTQLPPPSDDGSQSSMSSSSSDSSTSSRGSSHDLVAEPIRYQLTGLCHEKICSHVKMARAAIISSRSFHCALFRKSCPTTPSTTNVQIQALETVYPIGI